METIFEHYHAVSSDHIFTIGLDLHRVEPGGHGLQVRMPEVVVVLRNKKSLALIFVWGWVVGPALGYLISRVLPLASLRNRGAPRQPGALRAVPTTDGGKARGDMGFAGAFIRWCGRHVVLMPLMAPFLINGLTISTWALAKPLLLTILLPLIIGATFRHYADTAATKIFPVVKGLP